MSPAPETASSNQVPLVVDLDGTLIKTDMMWESLAQLLRRNLFWLLPILFWWLRGRAFLKRKLVVRVKIDPATLPYNETFLAYLHEQKNAGRKLILATASDHAMAEPIARHVKLFDEILASDGKTNLRGANKLKALTEKFGERGFDYAGNSTADFAVWRGSREAIVVNASKAVTEEATRCTKSGPVFPENYSRFFIAGRVLNELFIKSRYLYAALTGIFFAAAFPKISIAGFAWVAPALMLACARRKTNADAFRIGYVSGLSFWLATLYWLLLIPVAGFPILGWLVLSGTLALFTAVWVWLTANKIGKGSWLRRMFWSLAGAAIWVALEMIRARILGGFPWSFIGASQYQLTPLIQIASLAGVYGVSFLVVWVSLSLFTAVRAIFRQPTSRFAWQAEIFLPLIAVAVVFAFGCVKLRQEIPTDKTLRVTLIQPSVPQTLIWDDTANANRFQGLLALTESALTNRTDLLVWPEAAVPQLDGATFSAITNLVVAHKVTMIFNADYFVLKSAATAHDEYDAYNSAFLLNTNGNCADIYAKQRLVMFGEYVPFTRWLPFLKWFTPIGNGFKPGNKPAIFALKNSDAKTSPLICFEDTFPQAGREAATDDVDFLVNLTNDGWFGESAEQWQHAANAVFRAVESGLPLVRCANNGLTCWIDARGHIRQIFRDENGSEYHAGALTFELPLPAQRTATFYNQHGDWFGWICCALTGLILLSRFKRRFLHRKN